MPTKPKWKRCGTCVGHCEGRGQARTGFVRSEVERLHCAKGPWPRRRLFITCAMLEPKSRACRCRDIHVPSALPADAMNRMWAVAKVTRKCEILTAEGQSRVANAVGVRNERIAAREPYV